MFATLAAEPVRGEDAGEVASQWGLLGTWSVDCSAAPSRSNAHLSFVRVNGRLTHRRDFGDLRDEFPVLDARALPDGSLEIEVDLALFGQKRTIVFEKLGEGKKRAVLNRDDKGNYTIRDGKLVSTGKPAPVQTRCAVLTN